MKVGPIERRDIKLSEGSFQLTIMAGTRLVLGQLQEGSLTASDLLMALGKEGIREGTIERGLNLIAKGSRDQVPLAATQVIEVPAGTTNVGLTAPEVDQVAASGNMEAITGVDVIFPVKAGQILITVDTPPKIIERLPTGESRILHEGKSIDAQLFSGANTSVDQDGHAVLADIDGQAHRNIYGAVAVFPVEKIPGVGRTHGKVYKDGAVLVEQDVGDGSQFECAADLKVVGAVHSASIKAAGNVHIGAGADNPGKNSEAHIRAGQSVRARLFKDIQVWAGSYVIATEEVRSCHIECMDTIIAPVIISSDIQVGHRLIARDLQGISHIQLGSRYVTGTDLNKKVQVYTQHAKRLEDIDQNLNQHRYTYNKTRHNLVKQIELMRESAISPAQRQKAIQILLRLFSAMGEALDAFKQAYDDYATIARLLAQEQVGLDYYRQLQASFGAPHIMVTGTLAAGTVIQGPTDKIKPAKDLSNVRIQPDPHTGQLTTTPLER